MLNDPMFCFVEFSFVRDMGPPNYVQERPLISPEIKFPEYTNTNMNFTIQFIDDLPFEIKDGLFIIKLKWKI